MTFVYLYILIIGIACGSTLAALFWWTDRRNQKILTTFAAAHLLSTLAASVSTTRRHWKRALFIVAVFCCFAALARPQWGFRWEEVKRQGIDLMFAMDTSKSMLAQDVKPDRLTRAKLAVTDLLTTMGGDRVGLIAFAGTAFLQCPLTLDYEAFTQSLDALDVRIIPQGGTNIAAAIDETLAALGTQTTNHKILILLTDGEDLAGEAAAAAQRAANEGLKIFTVGVGTTAGELIPIAEEGGGVQLMKDAEGRVVKSRLDETTLKTIAETTGGFYAPLGARDEGLETIVREGLRAIPKQEVSSRMQRVYLERFQIPLALGIALLVIEFLMSDRKQAPFVLKMPRWRRKTAAAMLLLLLLPCPAIASLHDAQQAYQSKNFAEALRQYETAWKKNKNDPVLSYDMGAATYKNDQFDAAVNHFEHALKTSDLSVQQKTYYNLGNAHYRAGQATASAQPQQTTELWRRAIQAYEAALKLNPKDADAQFNLEFVKKKLEALQKQQNQKQEQQPKDQKQQSQEPQQKNQELQKSESPKDSQPKDSKDESNASPSQQLQSQQERSEKGKTKSEKQKNTSESKSQDQTQASPKLQEPQSGEATRRRVGEMSREEAESLLNAMKDEQAHPESLEGVPVGTLKEPEKDW